MKEILEMIEEAPGRYVVMLAGLTAMVVLIAVFFELVGVFAP